MLVLTGNDKEDVAFCLTVKTCSKLGNDFLVLGMLQLRR